MVLSKNGTAKWYSFLPLSVHGLVYCNVVWSIALICAPSLGCVGCWKQNEKSYDTYAGMVPKCPRDIYPATSQTHWLTHILVEEQRLPTS
jgi:hypothetical protein